MNKEERSAYQKEYRLKNNNVCTKKYEHTKKGKLVRTYRNMYSRVVGIVKDKAHLYKGLPILDREDFYSWSLSNKDYLTLYQHWVQSNYCKKLSPSIDRINTEEGYVISNMRWLTHSKNSGITSRNKVLK